MMLLLTGSLIVCKNSGIAILFLNNLLMLLRLCLQSSDIVILAAIHLIVLLLVDIQNFKDLLELKIYLFLHFLKWNIRIN